MGYYFPKYINKLTEKVQTVLIEQFDILFISALNSIQHFEYFAMISSLANDEKYPSFT